MRRDRYESKVGIVEANVLHVWALKAVHHMGVATDKAEEWETAREMLMAEPTYQRASAAERRKLREINWGMKDALAAYNWHINEANRLHQAIIAQHALRQMRQQP